MMGKQIQAVYEKGVIRPLEPVALTEGEELDVVLLPRHKRGEIAVLPIEDEQDGSFSAELAANFAAMQDAMNDELFLSDLREMMEDFRHADAEETPA